jgi:hypothetical protein
MDHSVNSAQNMILKRIWGNVDKSTTGLLGCCLRYCLLIYFIQFSVPWQVDHGSIVYKCGNVMVVDVLEFDWKNVHLTCPATANPSASKEVASQICRQTWNAAIDVVPCLAANDAARVTQNVTAMTLTNNINPVSKHRKIKYVTHQSTRIVYDHYRPVTIRNWLRRISKMIHGEGKNT